MDSLDNVQQCDHTSVGMLVWRKEKVLLIERGQFPYGFAPPAGHVDGDATFEIAAKRELKEEVGLTSNIRKILAEGDRQNICRRKGGTWHHWKIYQMDAEGDVKINKGEILSAGWFSPQDLQTLVQRTEEYLAKKVSEREWMESPGLEPIWCKWFQQLDII